MNKGKSLSALANKYRGKPKKFAEGGRARRPAAAPVASPFDADYVERLAAQAVGSGEPVTELRSAEGRGFAPTPFQGEGFQRMSAMLRGEVEPTPGEQMGLNIVRGFTEGPASIRAYHGSPHRFDRFDISKIGTGEGAQAYGHGLYFAEAEPVARGYRNQMSDMRPSLTIKGEGTFKPFAENNTVEQKAADLVFEMSGLTNPKNSKFRNLQSSMREAALSVPLNFEGKMKDEISSVLSRWMTNSGHRLSTNPTGHIYEVRLRTTPEELVNWNAPLVLQPERAVPFLEDVLRAPRTGSARVLEREMKPIGEAVNLRTPEIAAQLREAGIPGLRYLDAGSRTGRQNTRNYVMFGDDLIDITRRYAEGGLAELDQKYADGGRARRPAAAPGPRPSDEDYLSILTDRAVGAGEPVSELRSAEGRGFAPMPRSFGEAGQRLSAVIRGDVEPTPEEERQINAVRGFTEGPASIRAVPARPLVAIHNTSPEKLERMGAKGDVVVAPSIAVTRADQPYDPFGSISLVAPPATVNPSRTPVYARDAYTPRYPRVETRTVRGEEREVLPFVNENTGDWRYLPNTPENALRLMKREPWRGGEDWITDNWLLGQIAPQFRTMSELKGARERIVPTSDKTAENWINELNKLRSEWADAAKASGRRIDFSFSDSLQRNLAEAMQRGESGMEKINREYYGGSIPEDLLRRTREFLQTGRELPTTYFEAKPRRLVPLSEFEGAVIPANTPDEIRKILERNYIKDVLEYSNPQERTEQVGRLRNLFFSGAPLAVAGLSDLDEKYAEGGMVREPATAYDPDEIDRIVQEFAEGGEVEAPAKTYIGGQEHKLAYITPEEAALLKARGGSGRMTRYGVPAFDDGNGGNGGDGNGGDGSNGSEGGNGTGEGNEGATSQDAAMSEAATQDAVGGNQGQGAGPTGAGAGGGPSSNDPGPTGEGQSEVSTPGMAPGISTTPTAFGPIGPEDEANAAAARDAIANAPIGFEAYGVRDAIDAYNSGRMGLAQAIGYGLANVAAPPGFGIGFNVDPQTQMQTPAVSFDPVSAVTGLGLSAATGFAPGMGMIGGMIGSQISQAMGMTPGVVDLGTFDVTAPSMASQTPGVNAIGSPAGAPGGGFADIGGDVGGGDPGAMGGGDTGMGATADGGADQGIEQGLAALNQRYSEQLTGAPPYAPWNWAQIQQDAAANNQTLDQYLARNWGNLATNAPRLMKHGGMVEGKKSLEELHHRYAEGGEVGDEGMARPYDPREVDTIASEFMRGISSGAMVQSPGIMYPAIDRRRAF